MELGNVYKGGIVIKSKSVSFVWGLLTIVFAGAIMILLVMLSGSDLRYRREEEGTRIIRQQLERSINSQRKEIKDKSFEDYFGKVLTETLSRNQLDTLERSFWDYEIEINGVKKKIESQKIAGFQGKAEIRLTEIEWERILPLNLHVLGSVNKGDKADPFESHLSVVSTAPHTITRNVITGKDKVTGRSFRKTAVIFTFADIKPDQEINIEVTVPGTNRES